MNFAFSSLFNLFFKYYYYSYFAIRYFNSLFGRGKKQKHICCLSYQYRQRAQPEGIRSVQGHTKKMEFGICSETVQSRDAVLNTNRALEGGCCLRYSLKIEIFKHGKDFYHGLCFLATPDKTFKIEALQRFMCPLKKGLPITNWGIFPSVVLLRKN